MSISEDIQSLSPSAQVEMFVIDMTSVGGTVAHFHAGISKVQTPIWWQGIEYTPLPIEATGFDIMTKGALPRPRIRVANVGGLLSAEAAQFDDLIGCKVTRKRTFVKYMDAANFPSGNTSADPNQHLPDDIWFIDRKVSENRYMIEWELASAFDLQGVSLPFRQVIQNSCQWKYRGPECGFTGGYFDLNDLPTTLAQKDCCPKMLKSCKARQGSAETITFGGYPGAHRNV